MVLLRFLPRSEYFDFYLFKLSTLPVTWPRRWRASELYFYCPVFKRKLTFLSNTRPPAVASWGARPGAPSPGGETLLSFAKELPSFRALFT